MPIPVQPEWNSVSLDVHCRVDMGAEGRSSTTVIARHGAAPFACPLDPALDLQAALREAALAYLKALMPRLDALHPDRDGRLLAAWVRALADGHPRFGWLPLATAKSGSPMTSFLVDDTAVLLASERLENTGKPQDFIASGFGLRVVGRLERDPGTNAPRMVRIASLAAALPYGPWRDASLVYEPADAAPFKAFFPLLTSRAREIGGALALYEPWYTRLRLHRLESDRVRFEVRGSAYDGPRGSETGKEWDARTPYTFYVRGIADDQGNLESALAFERVPQVAAATPRRALPDDPISCGPAATARERRVTRNEASLGKYLRDVTVPKSGDTDVGSGRPIRPVPATAQAAAAAAPALRSDAFGELSAGVNLDRFLARMQGWNITPTTYFRIAQFPIKVLARSGIRPGPGKDGLAVNARVSLGSWQGSFFDPLEPAQHPQITMHFATADLSTRSRAVRQGDGVAPAEYMGIAADPRWVWHEIGHVLLAGTVGELEFRFAHSAGDALAAIATDPQSALDGRARGATFPWVFVPRRHDRCAAQGWSWCGSMHLPPTRRAQPDRVALKGYWSEQILSSSLFRLYRALGGEATRRDASGAIVPDRAAREAASDYTLFLIVRAIELLNYAGAVEPDSPDLFVTALIDADLSRATFTTTVQDGGNVRVFKRAGGCAGKVIRWVFEMQGLYAQSFSNGPGLPPPVDLCIANARPAADAVGETQTVCDPGGYAPVSLEWTPADGGDAPWHSPTAIEVLNDGVHVTVGNRGQQTATGVSVKVWARAIQGSALPEWQGGSGWTDCGTMQAPNVAPGASIRCGAFALPAGLAAPYVVLAAAHCGDDPANVLATALPCATEAVRLADLVGGDNNLGLRYIAA